MELILLCGVDQGLVIAMFSYDIFRGDPKVDGYDGCLPKSRISQWWYVYLRLEIYCFVAENLFIYPSGLWCNNIPKISKLPGILSHSQALCEMKSRHEIMVLPRGFFLVGMGKISSGKDQAFQPDVDTTSISTIPLNGEPKSPPLPIAPWVPMVEKITNGS